MDDRKFEGLYARHAPGLLAFLTYRVGDRGLAEDLVADTFERVLRSRRPHDPRIAGEKTWVYSIALNRTRDVLRRRQGEVRAYERIGVPVPAAEMAMESIEQRNELLAALGALSDEERETVALRFGADMTLREVAKLTGIPLTTIEGRLYRGLRKLRDRLER
jgi:RNA polymerase sigma-70 factor (ECF subfamily)